MHKVKHMCYNHIGASKALTSVKIMTRMLAELKLTYVYVYVCMYVYIYVSMYMCVYVYIKQGNQSRLLLLA